MGGRHTCRWRGRELRGSRGGDEGWRPRKAWRWPPLWQEVGEELDEAEMARPEKALRKWGFAWVTCWQR